MSDYPLPSILKQDESSDIIPINSINIDYSENGLCKGIDGTVETVYKADIVHKYIEQDGMDLVYDHYDLNKSNSFYLLYDGDDYYYRVAYVSKPRLIREGVVWTIVVNLVGVKVGLTINLANVIHGTDNIIHGTDNVIHSPME